MERSPKRRRTGTAPYGDAHNDHYYEDEGQLHPEIQERIAVRERFKSRLEDIFEKYSKDFTGVGDEIDLVTGEVIVNNGHLQRMEDEGDLGNEISDEEEIFSADGRIEDDLDTGCSSVHDGSRISRDKRRQAEDDKAPLETLNYPSALVRRLQTPGHRETPSRPVAKDPRWQIPDVPEVEFKAVRASQGNTHSRDGDYMKVQVAIQQGQTKRRGPNQPHKSPGPSLWAQPRQYRKTSARWQQQPVSVSQESIWALEDGTSDAESVVQIRHREDKEHRVSGFDTRQPATVPRPEELGIDSYHVTSAWNEDGTGDHRDADKTVIRAPDGSIHTIQRTQISSNDKVHETRSEGNRDFQQDKANTYQRQLSRTVSIPNTTQDNSTPMQAMSSIVSATQIDCKTRKSLQLKEPILPLTTTTIGGQSGAHHTAYEIKVADAVSVPLSVNSTPLSNLHSSDPRMAPPSSLEVVEVGHEKPLAKTEQLHGKSLSASTRVMTDTHSATIQRQVKEGTSSMRSSKTGIFHSKYLQRKSSTTSVNKPFMPVRPSKTSTSNAKDTLQLHQVVRLIGKPPTVGSLAVSETIHSRRADMIGRRTISGCEKQTSSRRIPPQSPTQNNTIDLTIDDDRNDAYSRAERETTPIDTYSYALADPWPTRPLRGDRIPGLFNPPARRGSITTTDRSDDVSISRSYSPLEVIDRIVAAMDTDLEEMDPAQRIHELDQSVHEDDIERSVYEELESILYEKDLIQPLSLHGIRDDARIPLVRACLSTPSEIEKPRNTIDLCPLPQSPGRLAIDGSQESPRKPSPKYKHADIVAEFGNSRPLTKANLLSQQEIPSTSQDSVLSFLNSQETAHLSKRTPTPKPSILPQRSHRCSISSANVCGVNGVRCGRTFCFNCTSRAATQEDVEF